jgi:hypothetical protein
MKRLLAALLVVLASACGLERNPDYCCVSADVCSAPGGSDGVPVPCMDPDRPICDEEHRQCVPDDISSDCEDESDCTNAERPVCVDNRCRECDGTTGCEASSPVCDVGGAYTCGACEGDGDCDGFATTPRCETDSGACVECLDAATDCLAADAPICGADNTCRGCANDSECASEVCDEATGACFAESAVIYVATNGIGSGTCTQAAPCNTITLGVGQVTGSRSTIKVRAGSYSEQVTIDDRALTLVGTGADLSAGAAGPLLTVLGASTVTIEDLRLHDALGAPAGDGVRCALGGADAPILTLRGVRIDTNGRRGIDSSDCVLTVEASTIDRNTGGGVIVSGGTYALTNNMITRNGAPAGTVGGVQLANITTVGRFDFNTLADNVTTAGFAAGVRCDSGPPQTLSSCIVVGLAADQVSATNCSFAYTLSNEAIAGTGNLTMAPMFVDSANGNFHLMSTSPARDAADPAATLATDIDGEARPEGAVRDMGADEVHP